MNNSNSRTNYSEEQTDPFWKAAIEKARRIGESKKGNEDVIYQQNKAGASGQHYNEKFNDHKDLFNTETLKILYHNVNPTKKFMKKQPEENCQLKIDIMEKQKLILTLTEKLEKLKMLNDQEQIKMVADIKLQEQKLEDMIKHQELYNNMPTRRRQQMQKILNKEFSAEMKKLDSMQDKLHMQKSDYMTEQHKLRQNILSEETVNLEKERKEQKKKQKQMMNQMQSGIREPVLKNMWYKNLKKNECHLIAVTESFFSNLTPDNEIVSENWSVLRRDRVTDGCTDGLMLLARPGIKLERRKDLETNAMGDLWATFIWREYSVHICVVHIKQEPSVQSFFRDSTLFDIVNNVNKLKGIIIIIGCLKLEDASTEFKCDYENFLKTNNIVDINMHNNVYGNKLDAVLVQKHFILHSFVKLSVGLVKYNSNHPPLQIELKDH